MKQEAGDVLRALRERQWVRKSQAYFDWGERGDRWKEVILELSPEGQTHFSCIDSGENSMPGRGDSQANGLKGEKRPVHPWNATRSPRLARPE